MPQDVFEVRAGALADRWLAGENLMPDEIERAAFGAELEYYINGERVSQDEYERRWTISRGVVEQE